MTAPSARVQLPEPAQGSEPAQGMRPAPLGRGRRTARTAVLAAVFACAACGLVYELALVALGSYLIGDAVGQASIVLAIMVFAMGVGALLAKPLQGHAAAAFGAVELTLALLGGLSVLLLYAAFAWLNFYQPVLIVVAFLLGLLIGAEIPLLMVLLQDIRRQAAGSAVADLFAADYIGALVGGLAFPFLLLPVFGLLRGALVVGAVNAAIGVALLFTVFRRKLSGRSRAVLAAGALLVAVLLGAAYAVSAPFEVTARQRLYRDPVVHAERSRYQEIVLTQSRPLPGLNNRLPDLRLYLNGDLQFSSVDEYRYHEALVHPVLAGARRRVLVLGGGDGLALREILRYADVAEVTVVELDPAVVRLARHHPRIAELNGGAFERSRLRLVHADAMEWLRRQPDRFDAVVVDLPDPDETATAKLYSVEFYTLVRAALAPGARVVVQAGSPYFAARSYWCIDASLRASGLPTTAYHVEVPTFGDWGFLLAAEGSAPALSLPADAPPLRFLTPGVIAAASTFPADRPRLSMPPSTLLDPRIVEYSRAGWTGY